MDDTTYIKMDPEEFAKLSGQGHSNHTGGQSEPLLKGSAVTAENAPQYCLNEMRKISTLIADVS